MCHAAISKEDNAGVEELVEIAECIGGPSLAGVMRLLAQDHAGWAGGLLAS